jgi:hypothetical protein
VAILGGDHSWQNTRVACCRGRPNYAAFLKSFQHRVLLYDVSAMPIEGGPYLSAALLCEKALQETDGVVSLIRIVDRWTVSGPMEDMPQTAIQATMVVMFKSGIHRGPGRLTLTPISPRGARLPAMDIPVHFEDDEDRGVNVIVPMSFPVQESGIYWFAIALDGQIVSHIPLRVIYHQVVPAQTPPSLPNPDLQ